MPHQLFWQNNIFHPYLSYLWVKHFFIVSLSKLIGFLKSDAFNLWFLNISLILYFCMSQICKFISAHHHYEQRSEYVNKLSSNLNGMNRICFVLIREISGQLHSSQKSVKIQIEDTYLKCKIRHIDVVVSFRINQNWLIIINPSKEIIEFDYLIISDYTWIYICYYVQSKYCSLFVLDNQFYLERSNINQNDRNSISSYSSSSIISGDDCYVFFYYHKACMGNISINNHLILRIDIYFVDKIHI